MTGSTERYLFGQKYNQQNAIYSDKNTINRTLFIRTKIQSTERYLFGQKYNQQNAVY